MSENDMMIDADDLARIDAHAEHAALEWSLEPRDEAMCDHFSKWVIIRVDHQPPIELRIYLATDGGTHLQVHQDKNGKSLCLGEPLLQIGAKETREMAYALAKAVSIMARYNAEWEYHYQALRRK
jgi:hypothetical protein